MYLTYQTYANLLLRSDRPAVTKLKNLPELLVTAAEFETTLAAGKADEADIRAFTVHFNKMNNAKVTAPARASRAPDHGLGFWS